MSAKIEYMARPEPATKSRGSGFISLYSRSYETEAFNLKLLAKIIKYEPFGPKLGPIMPIPELK
jgi:hypothetical protein